MYAAKGGRLEILKFLVDKGLDVKPKNQFGYTALRSAQAKQRTEIVEYLKSQGAI